MKHISAAFACLISLAAAAHGQHSLGMHAHAGPGEYSACKPGRFDGPIKPYPKDEVGELHHEVKTAKEQAQRFFDQGLTFYYGFDNESAMRSFHQASVVDSDLAMAYWGIALAAGGDLNIPIDDPCLDLAREKSKKAYELRAKASPSDQLYIDALVKRYAALSPQKPIDLQPLGVDYALAMQSVSEKLPQDPDAGALYAYSLMNLRPWLWWTTSGQPSAEITEVFRVLKAGLPRFPRHIGLHHINIHATEEGPIAGAGQARDSADFLFKNAPWITPHLRHMPAHIYLLLGDWQGVVEANRKAVLADQPWVEACRKALEGCNQLLVGHYYSHDLLFLAVGHGNRGEWDAVLNLSGDLEKNAQQFADTQHGLEHYLTTKAMMMVHFGQWEALTKLPPPPQEKPLPDPSDPKFCEGVKYKLATAMWSFGRVMGHASLGKPTDPDVLGFRKAQGCVQSAGIGWGNNSASDILKVVQWRMLERMARMKGKQDASQMSAQLAVESEDLLAYDEPPGWYLSSRESYGAALYLGKDFANAEKVFREDLKRRPNNSRSLFGLWQALKAQESPEAVEAKARFEQQWKGTVLPKMEDM